MNNKNLLIAGIVVLVLLVGGFWLFQSGNSGPTVTDQENQNNEDNLTDNNTDNMNENDNLVDEGDTGDNSNQDTGNDTNNDTGEEASAEVVYTDNGYSPANTTVTVGTTVVFINESSRSMWTASDPHPVHTDYSDFDHRQGVGNGETYEYTFNEPGTYDYHNHLRANHTGTITVTQ